MRIPKSISFINYFNDGRHVEFYYGLMGLIAGMVFILAFSNPLLWFSFAGIISTAVANDYLTSDQISILHYVAAVVFFAPLLYLTFGWYWLFPLAFTLEGLIMKRSYWLLTLEVSSFITAITLLL